MTTVEIPGSKSVTARALFLAEIHPGATRPALVDCHGDHRIAMSFSVAGLRADGIELDDPGCVRKTFPEFHEMLGRLRQDWGLPG